MQVKTRCESLKKDGTRCKKNASRDDNFCHIHINKRNRENGVVTETTHNRACVDATKLIICIIFAVISAAS